MKRALASVGLLLAVGCATTRDTTATATVTRPVPSRPVPELVAALADPDPATRSRAAWELVGADAREPGLATALIAALDDPDRSVREAASWTVWNLHGKLEGVPEYDAPPKILRQTKPLYPEAAFRKKVEGQVDVRMLINEEGRVAHAEVGRSVRGLDAAALSCVRQWLFTPAQRKGRAAATMAVAPVSFRID